MPCYHLQKKANLFGLVFKFFLLAISLNTLQAFLSILHYRAFSVLNISFLTFPQKKKKKSVIFVLSLFTLPLPSEGFIFASCVFNLLGFKFWRIKTEKKWGVLTGVSQGFAFEG